jgi:formiminoglutamase
MYQSPDTSRWTGRTNPLDGADGLLWHQVVNQLDLSKKISKSTSKTAIAILGFCCDEGVRRNLGRTGAAKGPDEMRNYLGRFAVHFEPNELIMYDAGHVVCEGEDLEGASTELSDKVELLLKHGYFPILLGGGHEITYPHVKGIQKFLGAKSNVGLINLDAHFDVRQYPEGAHSGSGFRQLADEADASGKSFHYLPIGIQPSGNIRALTKWMKEHGQTYITANELLKGLKPEQKQVIQKFIDSHEHLYLTIDLDVISLASAPGVSAPAPFGLSPQLVLQIVQRILRSGKVISLDIAEFNPTYDDGRTARLTAALVYEVVEGYYRKFSNTQ